MLSLWRRPLSAAGLFYCLALILLSAFPFFTSPLAPTNSQTILPVIIFSTLLCVVAVLCILGFREVFYVRSILPLAGFLLAGVAALSGLRIGFSGDALWGLGFEEGTVGFFLLFAFTMLAASFTPRRSIAGLLYALVGFAALSVVAALTMFLFSRETFDSILFAGSWPQFAFLYEAGLLTAFLLFKDAKDLRARVLLGTSAFVCATALFLIFGPYATSLLSLRPDIRPSPFLTTLVAGEEYLRSPQTILLGLGPKTFVQLWERNRPPELNRSVFGDGDFSFGYSSGATLLISLGAIGLVVLLLPFLSAAMLLTSALRRSSVLKHRGALASAGLALFCLGATLFTVPGPAIFLLGAMAAGFSATFLGESVSLRIAPGFIRGMLIALPLLLIGVPLLVLSQQQLRAARDHARGGELLSEGKAEQAAPLLLHAVDLWSSSLYERDASRGAFEAALAELARAEGDEIPKTETFTSNINKAVEMAERAVHSNTKDWKAWLAQASLYLALLKIKTNEENVSEFAQKIQNALQQAYQLSPTRPEIQYLYAHLALAAGERAKAEEYLTQALALKPNYEQAQTLLEQLQGSQ